LREKLALQRRGADLVLLAQLRVHVPLLARDVQVAAENEPGAFGLRGGRELLQAFEEPDLRGKILAAVRDVHGGEQEIAEAHGDDSRLGVKLRMCEAGAAGEGALAQVQRYARVAL